MADNGWVLRWNDGETILPGFFETKTDAIGTMIFNDLDITQVTPVEMSRDAYESHFTKKTRQIAPPGQSTGE